MPEPSSEITIQTDLKDQSVKPREWIVAETETGVDGGGIPPTVEAAHLTADESAKNARTPGEPASETSNTASELKQKTADTFSEERQHYSEGIQSAQIANAVLERFIRQNDQKKASGSPFSQLSSESSAALLLRVEEIHTQKAGDIDFELLKELRLRVATDAAASALFYPELYANLSSEQLTQEISTVSSAITSGESVSGHQLRILLEKSYENKASGSTDLPEGFTESLKVLQDEQQKRALTVSEVANALDVDVESSKFDLASNFFSNTGLEVSVVSKNDEKLVVQTTTAEGDKVETEVKKPDLVKMMLLMTISDVLLGTKNLEQMSVGLLKAGIAPLLEKWGIDPEFFLDSMDYQQYEVFDQVLETMTDDQCADFFSKSVDNKSLPRILGQCHPDHILKMFNPTGTQRFGPKSFFGANEHQLSQELVDKMYDSLTLQQRKELRIPEKAVAPAA